MSRRVVDPARLGFVEAVASSHSHTDHLDPVTLRAVAPLALVCPAETCTLARERAGVEPLPIEEGETVVVAGFALTAVRAEHDAPGGAVGYVVRCGPWTLYHAGDTLAYDGLGTMLRPFALDLALLPINGQLGNMDGRDAARVAHEARAALAIPCHYDMFEFNTASPGGFVEECERLGQPQRVLRAGERLTLAPD
jgi:L-ascorbate metabolism protein UlaG (beta-lactamase superfamily)